MGCVEDPLPKEDFYPVNVKAVRQEAARPAAVQPAANAFKDDFILFDDNNDDQDDDGDIDTREQNGVCGGDARDGSVKRRRYSPPSRNVRPAPDTGRRHRQLPPWIASESQYYNETEAAQILCREVADLANYLAPTDEEHALRKSVVEKIRTVVTEYWDDARLEVFGSFDTKLYLPNGDIDLVVLSNGSRLYGDNRDIRALANRLRKRGMVDANSLQIILKARVPLIKFAEKTTGINIDISFNRPSGLSTLKYTLAALEDHPALRYLVILVKYFLYVRSLHEPYMGGLGSYSVICLCISFLKMHPRVASGDIAQEDNLGTLLIEFFELYGKYFAFDCVGIDVADNAYYDKSFPPATLQIPYNARNPAPLQIIDPTDPSNDIARSSHNFQRVRQAFSTAFDVLVSRMFQLNAYLRGYKPVPKSEIHDGGTVLGELYHIDSPIIEMREILRLIWERDYVAAND